MEQSLYKIGLQQTHDSYTPNKLVAVNEKAHNIWVNMVPTLKNIKDNPTCIMLEFHYNNHIVEIRGLNISGLKRGKKR